MEGVLFDGKGRPVAFIEDDGERVFYLWNGHAVAYLVEDRLYGWNGRHIGWYSDSVMYDLHGQRVGSLGDKCPRALQAVRTRPVKHSKQPKYARQPEHKPVDYRHTYSEQDFEEFLKSGATWPAVEG